MYYRLGEDGRTPVPCDATETMFGPEDDKKRRVGRDEIGDVVVSTVFLSLNHAMLDDNRPVLFETMIFGGEHDQYQDRYYTYEEAERGHQKAIGIVKGEIAVDED